MRLARRRLVVASATVPALWLARHGPIRAAGLKDDEQVLLFPGTARRRSDGRWRVRIEAWVHELERRPGANQALAHYLGIDLGDLAPADRARYEARTQLFRVDHERGRVLQIRFDSGLPLALPASDSNGSVNAEVTVTLQDTPAADVTHWLDYVMETRRNDPRSLAGRTLAPSERGVSVISDIDDTIKHTQVRDRRAMLLNTFAREFAAVPGMAAWMRRCAAADPALVMHYVSGGPVQLYPPIAQFLVAQAFPPGTVHMRTVDVTRELFAAESGTRAHKLAKIGQLMADFPLRRFVLVGDSGEQDPEIYGDVARAQRGRIAAIFIRNVTGEGSDAPRYRKAMRDVPGPTWRVFDDPATLPDLRFA